MILGQQNNDQKIIMKKLKKVSWSFIEDGLWLNIDNFNLNRINFLKILFIGILYWIFWFL